MKTVRITSGTYGFRRSDGHLEPKRAGDIIEVPDDEAERIIKRKVGIQIAAETVATPPATPEGNAGGNDTPNQSNGSVTLANGVVIPVTLGIVDGHFVAGDLEQMTNTNLSKLATDLGLDIKTCKVKADFVALLATADLDMVKPDDEDNEDDEDDAVNDGETPPVVTPAGPVS